MTGPKSLPNLVHSDEGTQHFMQHFSGFNALNPYRPLSEPHRSLYDALCSELAKRPGRTSESATAAEIDAFHSVAVTLAPKFNLPIPTKGQVTAAEVYASGAADYLTTWVSSLVRMLQADRNCAQRASNSMQIREASLDQD